MKFSAIMFIILSSVLYSCSSSSLQTLQSSPFDTCFYFIAVPANLDVPGTPHFDTIISRTAGCRVHFLKLPSWGTETRYGIIKRDTVPNVKESSSVVITNKQYGLIDITNISAGIYDAGLTACGNGGSFTIKIE